MSRLLISLIMAGMLVISVVGQAVPALGAEPDLTPVAPPVVREGDFAMRLVKGMGLAPASDEVEAQKLLASHGVAPSNGWISDYPVTPVVMGELRASIINSSRSGKLAMSKRAALTVLDGLAQDIGLVLDPKAERDYASAPPVASEPPPGEAPYDVPPAVNDYYTTDAPPIVTYYPPPYGYTGYYDWVDYPFYFTGYYYPGFFILHDFDRVEGHHHRDFDDDDFGVNRHFDDRRISNHRFDPTLARTVRVRPNNALSADRQGSALVSGRAGADFSGASAGGAGRHAVSERVTAAALTNSGTGSVPARNSLASESPGAVRGVQRFERGDGAAVSGRTFTDERRASGGSDFRSGGGMSFRSSDTFGRTGGGTPFRSFSSAGAGGGGSFRSFSAGSMGRGGESFHSFNLGPSSRGFSGGGGGGFGGMHGGGGGGGGHGRR